MKVRLAVPAPPLSPKPVARQATVESRVELQLERRSAPTWWIVRSLTVGLALLASVGCAGADGQGAVEADVSLGTAPTIFGGSPDDDHAALSSVVALKVTNAGKLELCSGALIAPNVVLTARHCVAHSVTSSVSCDENGESTNGKHVAGEQAPEAVAIYTGLAPKFSGPPEAVGKAIIAPKGDSLCDSDIALVVLDQAIPDVEPLAVRLGGGVAQGETVRSVGYGQNDKRMPLGTRLRKDNVAILAMGKGVSESKTALGPHEFEVGRSICQGDSGGPALSEDTGAVVGVVSRGGNCDDDYGHIYTTTVGWSQLFDQAFQLAGGAPIVESGQPVGNEVGPRPRPTPPAPVQPSDAAESCSASGTPHPSSGASLALVLGAALVARARRAGRARRDG